MDWIFSCSKLYLFHLNQKMSVLSQKLQEASKLFQTHNFKKSLDAYKECVNFCYKTQQDQTVIFNILSTKATLEYILGDYDTALATLNSVLTKDPYHYLSLMRRSQVYKKKNKLKKAFKDLQKIYVFCPDNLQISAFKVQIQHLILKQGNQGQISSQSQEENEDDEEKALNFIKLKLIDRKSSDQSAIRSRQSRVTITGDSIIQYKTEEANAQTNDQQTENLSEKAIRTYKEIQLDDKQIQSGAQPFINIIAPKKTKKSILKNKGVSIFIQPEDEQSRKSKYLGRQSKLISLIKNIDGKIIPPIDKLRSSNNSIKEVEFRKSISLAPPKIVDPFASQNSNQSINSDRSNRKSCLKRPSFDMSEITKKQVRRSRFESIDDKKIDGKPIVHKKRKSIENKQYDADHVQSGSDEDEDNEHNIFGSKGVVMSQDLKQQLGLTFNQEFDERQQLTKSLNLKPKMSILKKSSSILIFPKRSSLKDTTQIKQSKQLPLQSGFKNLKSKKSVVFNCTL